MTGLCRWSRGRRGGRSLSVAAGEKPLATSWCFRDTDRRGGGRGRRGPSGARDPPRRRGVLEDRRRPDAHRRRGRGDGDGAAADSGGSVAEAAGARARGSPGVGTRPPRRAVDRVVRRVGGGGCCRTASARRAATTLAGAEPRGEGFEP